ncbi:MAG: hypothetical protein JXI33_07220 [Candidatus Aminicenantes bacterium]|nr:hypothetical protein [Candidatus Aminicenantes bacterium]
MKKLLILLLALLAAYFAYQKFVVNNLSEEQQQVQAIADEFQTAKQRMGQAERTAAVAGLDTTSDADDIMHIAASLLEKLEALQEKLTEEKAMDMAEKLSTELKAYLARTK